MVAMAAPADAPLSIVWLQAGGCGGCSMALLGADTRDFTGMLEGAGLDLAFHPCLSEATGDEALALLDALGLVNRRRCQEAL